MVTSLQNPKEEKSMARGRRPKPLAPPKRSERAGAIRARLVSLPTDLKSAGFDGILPTPGVVELIAPSVKDSHTTGLIGHVEEPLGVLLPRVSVQGNFMQRPPFDHANDSIYRRLIRDFINGAAMPESKIAALVKGPGHRAESLDAPDIYYSIIDGLQRQYCYGLALLLVWRREALVDEGLITKDAWEYFQELVESTGDAEAATKALLGRPMRYEIFYNINLEGLLHYMVTFNTGQRRMSLDVQLEIMREPLIKELENQGIPIWKDMQGGPGITKPRELFAAADLVLAVDAFITSNPQVAATTEAERFHNENKGYLGDVGDITDVATTLKRIATELHPEIAQVYANEPSKRSVLSDRAAFLASLTAACGYVRTQMSTKALDGALDKLLAEIRRPADDPLGLEDYFTALGTITTSKGKATRRLVYDTFLRFFTGATVRLDWLDTARQITG